MSHRHVRRLALDIVLYEGDQDLCDAYREYLHGFVHDVLHADDLLTWLEFDPVGQEHAERVETGQR